MAMAIQKDALRYGTNCLGTDNFSDVYISCKSVKANWESLATHLKVHRPDVEAIGKNESDVENCLHKALSAWLKRSSKTQPKPSWRSLCDALADMGEVALSERIQREHPCGCGLCKATNVRETPVANAVRQKDSVTAASELQKLFDELLDLLDAEINHVDVHKLRLHIAKFFRKEEYDETIEMHLVKIEDYSTSQAVLNHFVRHEFIGYLNYWLVKVFQGIAKSPTLDKRIEAYEKDYLCFLKLDLLEICKVHKQCPDLRPKYPVGIPQFTIHLESEWDGKSVFELKEFLKRLFDKNYQCIDQLMIAKISRNCITITFAVLPHIARTVLQYLTNDVLSTLKKEGITVNISKQLMKYDLPHKEGKTTTHSVTMGIPSELKAKLKIKVTGTSSSIKQHSNVSTTDTSGYSGGDTEGEFERGPKSLKQLTRVQEDSDSEHGKIKTSLAVADGKKSKSSTKRKTSKLRDTVVQFESQDDLNKQLLVAVGDGQEKRVETLINAKADVNTTNKYKIENTVMKEDETPLQVASDRGHVKLVELLISRGAIVNKSNKYNFNWTPLHYAASKGHTDVVNALISLGATVDAVDDDDLSTPLHLASMSGHSKTVECLISHKAKVNTQDEAGQTPLHIATWNGHSDVVDILLSQIATAVDIKDNFKGQTALHLACAKDHGDIVDLLLIHRATVDVKDNEGRTPLHLASAFGRTNIVKMLLTYKAAVNSLDEKLQTPLHPCLLNSSRCDIDDTVELLISHGADLYQEDKYNQSPILIATVLGKEHLLPLLSQYEYGVSEDTIAKYRLPQGWTTLVPRKDNGIKYINIDSGKEQEVHPLFQQSQSNTSN